MTQTINTDKYLFQIQLISKKKKKLSTRIKNVVWIPSKNNFSCLFNIQSC